ncbi:MAG TPA: bifunctional diaminohydroxyphosphoribosylaminopyrimidine deaminase/5-amino-6-(5-phosphoribosylamino)uracil reductase RibD [Granulicella sp.]
MSFTAQDELYLHRALTLAQQTVGLASPNPQVGCVLVRDGEVLGEGAHLYENKDHAEIAALKDAAAKGHDVAGATAYVTLEPCSHHGRTGPCADALAAARIARVVIGTEDPNPLVSGNGILKLRIAGVEIDLAEGELQQQCRDVIEAFAHVMRHHRPFVTLKAAVSADGFLAPPPHTRTASQPFWLTGPEARAEVQRLRHASDAILTGIGTVLADNPALTDRSGLPRRRPLLRVVLDTHLHLPHTSQLLRTAENDLLLLCGEDASAETQRELEALSSGCFEIEHLQLDAHGYLSLSSVLAALERRGMLSVLLEGGEQITETFLQQGLVDKVVLFRSPATLGSGLPFPQERIAALTRIAHTSFGPDACTTGYLHDPWA